MSTSNYGVPIVDSFATMRQLSRIMMNNIVQELQQSNGKGITEKFSDNVFTDEIRIIRQKALTQKARTLAATTDGAAFSSQTIEQPISQSYGMRIRHIYNTPIDVPQSTMDMIPLDLLNSTVERLHQAISKNVNASTMAEQIAAALNSEFEGDTSFVSHTVGTDEFLDSLFDANAKLDEGDEDNGIDTFPMNTRLGLLRPSAKNYLLKAGKAVFDLGNWKGQDMLKVGGLDHDSYPNTNVDGHLGTIAQVEYKMTAPAVWTLAEQWLGLTAGDLSKVMGLLSASDATGRALAFQREIQMIPSPLGQGVRILPQYRWGHEVWFDKGIVLIVESDFVNPVDALDLAVSGTRLSVVAPGSQ